MNRAYSILTLKRVDDDARIIEGVATTPAPDRMGDVVEPLGVTFKNPSPLLWQHDSLKPVGQVTFGKPTAEGVTFKARIEKATEPGTLKDRLDEAWQSVKLGLVRAVSIGFKPLERSLLKDGGIRFIRSEVLELSLVTIPANAEATITAIKSIDRTLRAASGRIHEPAPGVTGHKDTKGQNMKTLTERIADLEAQIAPKRLRMKGLMDGAAEDGERDLNESEAEEFDGLSEEVNDLGVRLRRLKALDASAATARPVRGDDPDAASRSRGSVPAEPRAHAEKGLGFARMVKCYALASGNVREAVEIAKSLYPRDKAIPAVLKAQVPGATSTDDTWAGPLVEPTNLVSEFVEFLRPQTIIGRFGTGGIPSLRRVPFNISVPAQSSGLTGADWIGEGKPIKVGKAAFTRLTLRWKKVAGLTVLSEDLLRNSSPSAELLIRNELGTALAAKLDTDFADPSVSETTDVRPASITNGATTVAASGIDAAAVRADIKGRVSFFIANNIPTTGLVVLMRHAQALSLSLMRNALGAKEFPDMTMNGGLLEGIPVIASQFMPQGVVAFVSADNIYLADDGAANIALSREASIEMDSAPSNEINNGASPPVSVEATMVSMFQTESVAVKAVRVVDWKRRRSNAVTYLTGTGWGNADTSPAQPSI